MTDPDGSHNMSDGAEVSFKVGAVNIDDFGLRGHLGKTRDEALEVLDDGITWAADGGVVEIPEVDGRGYRSS